MILDDDDDDDEESDDVKVEDNDKDDDNNDKDISVLVNFRARSLKFCMQVDLDCLKPFSNKKKYKSTKKYVQKYS